MIKTLDGIKKIKRQEFIAKTKAVVKKSFFPGLGITVLVLGLVLSGVPFGTSAVHTPADGLMAYWDLDGDADELTVHDLNGTEMGGITYASSTVVVGDTGNAVFDGVDDFIEIPHSADLDMTSAYSVSVWANVTDVPANIYRPIAFRAGTDANDIEVYIQAVSGDLIVAHNRGNGGSFDHVGFDNPPVGTDFHLAVTFNGTDVMAYYNGVAATVTQNTTAMGAPNDTDKGWWFGKVDHASFGTLAGGNDINLFKGTLNEVRIYDTALSAGEVSALHDYNFGVILTPEEATNLVGEDHTVTATLDPALGFIPVLFEVTGAHLDGGLPYIYTDHDGMTEFSYTGTSVGDDTIIACIDLSDLINGSVCDAPFDEPSDTAIKHWTITSITLTPEWDFNPLGWEHTVTAQIDPAQEGVEILFVVDGSNSESGTELTDDSGMAEFIYAGTVAGLDTITACHDVDDSDTCEEGETQATVEKLWLDGAVWGGGQILEEIGPKKSDDFKISFGGWAGDSGADGLVGEWEVNFHNVGVAGVDKSKFHGSEIEILDFQGSGAKCIQKARIVVEGEYNHIPGYRLVIRTSDGYTTGFPDTMRFTLRESDGDLVYDSSPEFEGETSCLGNQRTKLDNGNIVIIPTE